MKQELKIKLLKRKFQSLTYIEDFIANYQAFVQIGLDALEIYQQYRKNHPEFEPNKTLIMEEDFWEHRVKPNFTGMLRSSNEAIADARKGDNDAMGSLAGSFRGLSRGFDGIEEEFMDVATPDMRKQYRRLWNQASDQATIIESTINEWWDDDEILRETITGPIDENELLNYLEPGESLSD